ncbi:MAG: OPT family oligopeptide transporter [Planctomycetota bacterium]|jgi:putative OPT family oligopeptide transporter
MPRDGAAMADATGTNDLRPSPTTDLASPQFTARAILTGVCLGGLLSICNIYLGLKSGLIINMSLVAALVGYGFWSGVRVVSGGRVRTWGILENNINQTASSAGASVASAGLVHAVPALAMMTGQTLAWHHLVLWILSVCLVGIAVAVALRRHLVVDSKLPFPVGIASAEMLREMHSRGAEAVARIVTLASGAVVSACLYLAKIRFHIPKWPLPFTLKGMKADAWTFAVDPSLLWVGVGGLIGFRACASVMIGSVVALGLLAPALVEAGTIAVPSGGFRYSDLQAWLMWPGVAIMVVASLTSLAFSWRSVVAAVRGVRQAESGPSEGDRQGVPGKWFLFGLLVALVLSTVLQVTLFDIVIWAAVLGVLLAFALAMVAARVSGETGITPVGSMGKMSQIVFGILIPRNPVPNLMAANVSGGAASQCADLLHDLKCGHLLGASARLQSLAQVCGVLIGSLVGSIVYLMILRDPAGQLMTEEWPAPGVAAWKAVAELFRDGLAAMPPATPPALLIGAAVGLILAAIEKLAPEWLRPFTLSPASLGLAFVIPAHYAISLFLGGTAALIIAQASPNWSKRFLVAACAGLIAGQTLTGSGHILWRTIWG